MASEQFSLCWDNFHRNMSTGMQSLLESEDLVDVTLAVEGRHLKAHKMVLSICSPYFRELFQSNPCKHPIVFMKDVSYIALTDLLQFMYQGEVQVAQENLTTFIKTAEALQIKGLTGESGGQNDLEVEDLEKTFSDSNKRSHDSDSKQVTTRVRKLSGPASKRAKLSPVTSTPNRQSGVSFVSTGCKFEVTSVNTTDNGQTSEDPNLKVEPETVEQVESITLSESQNEQYVEDSNVDYIADDTEDFSLIESGVDEPKASTSTDAGGESQDDGKAVKRKSDMPRYIVDGFVFHVNIMKGKPQMMYLRCLEYKRLGCHARAIIPCDGSIHDIKVKKLHNHPPDYTAEEKIVFLRELKQVLLCNPSTSIKEVYTALSNMYPNAAREIPFNVIRHKMNRWRKTIGTTQTSA